jgi:magnesium chelatase subunit D
MSFEQGASASGLYPFSALVGQEALCEALLIGAVDSSVGGVLVRGERGCAKSTAVRALAPLLPPVAVARGARFPYGPGEIAPDGVVPVDLPCEPRAAALVELPLGASIERLLGAIDLKRALAGEVVFEPGVLARAHRGILYVDEINLLPDHLVDALLDAAASGSVRIEREAFSVEHQARFLLVGSMNPEEGELRPQLADRFGLAVSVSAPRQAATRAQIVKLRLEFEAQPGAFIDRYRHAQQATARQIADARKRLGGVQLQERQLAIVAELCARLGVEGLRGDIACARAARALAALEGSDRVSAQHLRRAAELALAHRLREDPLAGSQERDEQLQAALAECLGEDREQRRPARERGPDRDADGDGQDGGERAEPSSESEGGARQAQAEAPASAHTPPPLGAQLKYLRAERARLEGAPPGRSARGSELHRIDAREARSEAGTLALLPSLRMRALIGARAPLYEAIHSGAARRLLCLIVDASGSMGARRRLARIKGALLELLGSAYTRREQVALIAFAGDRARLLADPRTPLERTAALIRALPAGGRTPLAEALELARRLVEAQCARGGRQATEALLFTDGRFPEPPARALAAAARLGALVQRFVVVEAERRPFGISLAPALARAGGGDLAALDVGAARAAFSRAAR